MKDILSQLDTRVMRLEVYKLYKLPPMDESALQRAYITFMVDQALVQKVRVIKQSHERFMIAILNCDVFPGLDKHNPLASAQEDLIPDKFGNKWYEHQEGTKKVFKKIEAPESDEDFEIHEANLLEDT